jgi:antitoxin Phd
MTWQLQDAKNRLSELVETSLSKGPQIISRRGKDTAVLMSFEDYMRYTGPKRDLKKTLMSTGFDTLDLKRDKSTTGRALPINFE